MWGQERREVLKGEEEGREVLVRDTKRKLLLFQSFPQKEASWQLHHKTEA